MSFSDIKQKSDANLKMPLPISINANGDAEATPTDVGEVNVEPLADKERDSDTELQNRISRVEDVLKKQHGSSPSPGNRSHTTIMAHIMGDSEKSKEKNEINHELNSKLLRADRIAQSSSLKVSQQSPSYQNIKSSLLGIKGSSSSTKLSDADHDQQMKDRMERVDHTLAASHSKISKERDTSHSHSIKATLLSPPDKFKSTSEKNILDPEVQEKFDRADDIIKKDSSTISKPKVGTTPNIKSLLMGNSSESKSSKKPSKEQEAKEERAEKTLAKSKTTSSKPTTKSPQKSAKGAVLSGLMGSVSNLLGSNDEKNLHK